MIAEAPYPRRIARPLAAARGGPVQERKRVRAEAIAHGGEAMAPRPTAGRSRCRRSTGARSSGPRAKGLVRFAAPARSRSAQGDRLAHRPGRALAWRSTRPPGSALGPPWSPTRSPVLHHRDTNDNRQGRRTAARECGHAIRGSRAAGSRWSTSAGTMAASPIIGSPMQCLGTTHATRSHKAGCGGYGSCRPR